MKLLRAMVAFACAIEIILKNTWCLGFFLYNFSTGKVRVVPPYEVHGRKYNRNSDFHSAFEVEAQVFYTEEFYLAVC